MKKGLKILLFFLVIMLSLILLTTVVKAKTVDEHISDFQGDLSGGSSEGGDNPEADESGEDSEGSGDDTKIDAAIDSVSTIVGKILSYLQVGTALLTVIIIASIGFRYIVETPEVKGDIKKSMFPIVTGIIFVFFATSIAKFFMGLFSKQI